MSDRAADFESLLRQALAPIEPPADLEARLEDSLTSLVETAVEELEGWEMASIRDPRNWPHIGRPVAAGVVGGAAAIGLVLVRTQRKRHRRRASSDNVLQLVERTVRDLAHEAGKLVDETSRRR